MVEVIFTNPLKPALAPVPRVTLIAKELELPGEIGVVDVHCPLPALYVQSALFSAVFPNGGGSSILLAVFFVNVRPVDGGGNDVWIVIKPEEVPVPMLRTTMTRSIV